MAEFKLTISDPKTGKSIQREAKEADAAPFVGKKIGDKIAGEVINLTGYEFEITGGSDNCGFPMRRDVRGPARAKILAIKGVGIQTVKGKGIRQRKTVRGNTISDAVVQINLKVIKQGKEDIFGGAKEGEAEEKKEAPKEEKAEKPEEEKEKSAKKEEKPAKEEKAEEKKEAPKEESK